MIKSGQLAPNVLIDVLYDGRGHVFGDGYDIIHKMLPQKPSKSVINTCIVNQNNISNSKLYNSDVGNITIGSNNSQTSSLPSVRPYGSSINKALGSDVKWSVEELGNAYRLIPDTNQYCVNTEHRHSEPKHSCIYVRRLSVIAHCFSHGRTVIQGQMSRYLREVFLKYSTSNGILTKTFDEILSKAESEKLFRKYGFVFRRTGNTHEFVNSYEDFSIDCLEENAAVMEYPRWFHELMISMDKIKSNRFPFVAHDRRYIGFKNGLLDIVSGELRNNDAIGSSSVPWHYIDHIFQVDDLETPLFDKIVRHQLENYEVYTYMLALIGRLFYEVGQFDKLDVIPFIVGDTSTGKSTLAQIISAMFQPSSVGSLNSTHEVIFGLQSLYDK